MQNDTSRAVQVGEFYELEVGKDLTPSSPLQRRHRTDAIAQRTWNEWHIAALGLSWPSGAYLHAGGGVTTYSVSVGEALWAVFIANVIVLIPLTLDAFGGTKSAFLSR